MKLWFYKENNMLGDNIIQNRLRRERQNNNARRDIEEQSLVTYYKECSLCTTRKATPEELDRAEQIFNKAKKDEIAKLPRVNTLVNFS